ncbi:MAG: hypothetical protein ACRD24_15980 [Terriglobales bacterium]
MRVRNWFAGTVIVISLVGCSSQPREEAGKPSASPASQTSAVPAGPFAKCDIAKFTPEENAALNALHDVSAAALICSSAAGLTFDKLYNEGCAIEMGMGSKLTFVALKEQIKDPRQLPEYEFVFQLQPRVDLAMTPKKAGLAGFSSDGVNAYCNALGRASNRPEQSLGTHSDLTPRGKGKTKGK